MISHRIHKLYRQISDTSHCVLEIRDGFDVNTPDLPKDLKAEPQANRSCLHEGLN